MISVHSFGVDPVRWARALPLLTLDRLQPFYSAMGLSAVDPHQMQLVLRDHLIRARSAFGPSLFANPVAVESVASDILAALGPRDARSLACWIEGIFHADPVDGKELRAWTTLLRHCRRAPKMWDSLFASPHSGAETLNAFELSINIDPFEQQFAELGEAPLSDWDLHIYAINFFDEDDSEGAPNGPHLWIAPTVRDVQGHRFWRWMQGSFSAAELTQIRRQAEAIWQSELLSPEGPMPDPNKLGVDL